MLVTVLCVCVLCVFLSFWASKNFEFLQDKGAYKQSFPFVGKFSYYLLQMGTLLDQR